MGVCSLSLDITKSIVRGSGIGQYAFITYVTDFKTLGYCNYVLKYADDFFLLVQENSDVSATDELKHIISWSNRNKFNLSKCRELVFKRPNLKHEISPCTLANVIRVNIAKLLGVYIDHNISIANPQMLAACIVYLLNLTKYIEL